MRVAFFDDRIEIENPGILPPGITVEDMKQGVSKIRNPVIAKVFRELNLIEQWGSGVPRIFRETAEGGFPKPSIVELGLRTRFVFPLAQSIKIKTGSAALPGAESGAESGVESKMALRILNLLEERPLSKAEIAKAIGKKKPTRYLNDLMKKLLQYRQVEYTIPEKPNSRLQKYKLTAKGRNEEV